MNEKKNERTGEQMVTCVNIDKGQEERRKKKLNDRQ
jgi:hypothetical protein